MACDSLSTFYLTSGIISFDFSCARDSDFSRFQNSVVTFEFAKRETTLGGALHRVFVNTTRCPEYLSYSVTCDVRWVVMDKYPWINTIRKKNVYRRTHQDVLISECCFFNFFRSYCSKDTSFRSVCLGCTVCGYKIYENKIK